MDSRVSENDYDNVPFEGCPSVSIRIQPRA